MPCPFSGAARHEFVPEPVFGWRSPISPWIRNRVGEKGGRLEDVVRRVAPHFAPRRGSTQYLGYYNFRPNLEGEKPRVAKKADLRLFDKYEVKQPVEAATVRALERIEDASKAMPEARLRYLENRMRGEPEPVGHGKRPGWLRTQLAEEAAAESYQAEDRLVRPPDVGKPRPAKKLGKVTGAARFRPRMTGYGAYMVNWTEINNQMMEQLRRKVGQNISGRQMDYEL